MYITIHKETIRHKVTKLEGNILFTMETCFIGESVLNGNIN